jgi:hypothetical protein
MVARLDQSYSRAVQLRLQIYRTSRPGLARPPTVSGAAQQTELYVVRPRHAMFLRVGIHPLPDGLDLAQEYFCKEWMCVEDTMAAALDTKVRDAGWYFMWLHSSYSRLGVGRGATSAVGRATTPALNRVKPRFNAAELDLVNVTKYPGFQVARVTIHAR